MIKKKSFCYLFIVIQRYIKSDILHLTAILIDFRFTGSYEIRKSIYFSAYRSYYESL